ncbi:unnamed protein product [Rotaria sordida]|uniref:Uncharacterized protein n=1 Tax=Rotaria sordida TaxID=392033 RepID=A0A814TS53_9BILA|nr:unnamed protein product [Rotaria sordida]CAF3838066.1 unnamed protein product [Rotaria sordida]
MDSSPSTDQNFISNTWAYTYGKTIPKNKHPTASGQVVNPNIRKPCASTTSTVEHIIIIISENHSFDSIYGRYCQAATGSRPTCNIGPSCCEAASDSCNFSQNPNLNGARCYKANFASYYSTTIADLLNYCGVHWTFYAEGYDQNPNSTQCYPNYYDATDDPFTYFPKLKKLPAVSYVKGLGIHSEHPAYGTITAGETISQDVINAIRASNTYRKNTVIFLVADESGGYYDHVSPPPNSTIDNQPYGPRMPFVAIGHQIKRNYVSHVQMEPSSLIKFIEWNWLNGPPGQLGTRDTVVNNIGDMFDHKKTGVKIPSN